MEATRNTNIVRYPGAWWDVIIVVFIIVLPRTATRNTNIVRYPGAWWDVKIVMKEVRGAGTTRPPVRRPHTYPSGTGRGRRGRRRVQERQAKRGRSGTAWGKEREWAGKWRGSTGERVVYIVLIAPQILRSHE